MRYAELRALKSSGEPLYVVPTKNPDEPPNTEWERNVKVVQLVAMNVSHKAVGAHVGKDISVTGRLFHSFTGHHHARILMELDKVTEE
jgi:hypothetical protein